MVFLALCIILSIRSLFFNPMRNDTGLIVHSGVPKKVCHLLSVNKSCHRICLLGVGGIRECELCSADCIINICLDGVPALIYCKEKAEPILASNQRSIRFDIRLSLDGASPSHEICDIRVLSNAAAMYKGSTSSPQVLDHGISKCPTLLNLYVPCLYRCTTIAYSSCKQLR